MKHAVARLLWTVLGRRNLVRVGRFLTNYSRLDLPNDMHSNGELLVHRVLLDHLPDGEAIVFDVGANLGLWTTHLLQAAQSSSKAAPGVCLFEPSKATYERLCRTLEAAPFARHTRVFNHGMSDAAGEASFYVLGAEDGAHSLYQQASLSDVTTKQTIELKTIDGFCAEQGIESLHFVKTDIEGNDLKALQGASTMLSEKRIEALQFEYNHRWIEPRCFLRDAFELLEGHGYRLGKITPRGIEFYPGWDRELETFVEGNYLACLPHWVERFPRISWWNS